MSKGPSYVNANTAVNFSVGVLGGALGIDSFKLILGVLFADCVLVALDDKDPFACFQSESLGNHTVNVLATWAGIVFAQKTVNPPTVNPPETA
jgi:hypothetical protein